MIKLKFRAVVVSVLCCVAVLAGLMSPASAGRTIDNVYHSDEIGNWSTDDNFTQYDRTCGDYIAGIAVKTDSAQGINAVNVLCGGNLTAGPDDSPLWQGWQGDTADTDIYPDETENVNCPTSTGDAGHRVDKIRVMELSFIDNSFISQIVVWCSDGSKHTLGERTVVNGIFISTWEECPSAAFSTLSTNMSTGQGLEGLSFTCNLTDAGNG